MPIKSRSENGKRKNHIPKMAKGRFWTGLHENQHLYVKFDGEHDAVNIDQ